MPEIPHTGKDHCHMATVCRFDHFVVPDRPAGLHQCRRSCISCHFERVSERQKRIGRYSGSTERGTRFFDRNLCRIHPAHLPCPDAERPLFVRKDDRVGLRMLAHFPRKLQSPHLIRSRIAVRDHFPVLRVWRSPLDKNTAINRPDLVLSCRFR